MADQNRAARQFGKLVSKTSNMTDPVVLAHYMLVLLKRMPGKDGVPDAAEFTLQVTPVHESSDSMFTLLVYGLTDQYLTGGKQDPGELARYSSHPYEYTPEALYLFDVLANFMSLHAWSNPTDPQDRRFWCDVKLLTENEQKSGLVFPPGEIWTVSLKSNMHLPSPW